MNQVIFTLTLGFILGIKHAFDADHLVAVSTLVSHHKNPFKAALVGTFWGIGHTLSLFIVGLIVILLRINISENISLFFEFIVGMMLVILGFHTLFNKEAIHQHLHHHNDSTHSHIHFDTDTSHHHQHKRSIFIGMIHGLAGSGALTILVLSTISSVIAGIFYILVFGIGSLIGMSLMSMVFGLPFILTHNKFPNIQKYLKVIVGILSILFGTLMVNEIGGKLHLFQNMFKNGY